MNPQCHGTYLPKIRKHPPAHLFRDIPEPFPRAPRLSPHHPPPLPRMPVEVGECVAEGDDESVAVGDQFPRRLVTPPVVTRHVERAQRCVAYATACQR